MMNVYFPEKEKEKKGMTYDVYTGCRIISDFYRNIQEFSVPLIFFQRKDLDINGFIYDQ